MRHTNQQPAVFLDRDGTVNEQMGYINHISRFHLLPEAAAAIKLLNDKSIPVVVVSNQSGVARGYFPRELVDEVHGKMKRLLAAQGAFVDGIYICPHHPEAKMEKYRQQCNCRKPKTGMLEQAAAEMNLDLKKSFLIGDRWSDLQCAVNAGSTPVLVLTGYGRGDYQYIGPKQGVQPAFVGDNLMQAVEWVLAELEQGNN
jgi:D-glycero-D-manno-heptose 1,7-bisphosphate phosphatase